MIQGSCQPPDVRVMGLALLVAWKSIDMEENLSERDSRIQSGLEYICIAIPRGPLGRSIGRLSHARRSTGTVDDHEHLRPQGATVTPSLESNMFVIHHDFCQVG